MLKKGRLLCIGMIFMISLSGCQAEKNMSLSSEATFSSSAMSQNTNMMEQITSAAQSTVVHTLVTTSESTSSSFPAAMTSNSSPMSQSTSVSHVTNVPVTPTDSYSENQLW